MKKALSLFMAVLMMFAAMAVGASAESSVNPSPWHGPEGSGKPATPEQAVLSFDLNGGTMKNAVAVYDLNTGTFTSQTGVTGTWYMVPANANVMKAGMQVTLPVVTAPKGYQFDGWYCYNDGQPYAANMSYTIPATGAGSVIQFRAAYSPAEIEEDSMTKVLSILTKVFGAIIGILLYAGDTEKGIALVEKMLSGILG